MTISNEPLREPTTTLELLCQEVGIPYTAEHQAFEENLERLRQLGELARFASYVNELDYRYAPHAPDPSLFERHIGGMSAATAASEKHPDRNEDAYFTLECNGVRCVGVFDGLGGNDGSERSSHIAAETTRSLLESLVTVELPPEVATDMLRKALEIANSAIEHDNEALPYTQFLPSTTAAVASIHTYPDTNDQYAALAWVGDSRIYILRDGECVYSTLDDGITAEELFTLAGAENTANLTQRQLQQFLETVETDSFPVGDQFLEKVFQHRNLIGNSLDGTSNHTIHTDTVPVKKGDIVLGTTDGVHDNLTLVQIERLQTAQAAVDAARRRSDDPYELDLRAKMDDMTAAAMDI